MTCTRRVANRIRRAYTLATRAWWLASLGADRRDSVKILVVALTMPAKRRLRALAPRPVRLRLVLRDLATDVWLSDYSELLVLEEIWRRGEYEPAATMARDASTIVDLGANIGLASLWFRSLNPAALIVAVEPDPRTFAKLALNVAHDPGIEAVNAAIADHNGAVRFTSSADSWESRVTAESSAGVAEVASTTLDELVRARGLGRLDLVKMDIEGMEWTILPSAACLRETAMVIGEIHPDPQHRDPDRFLDGIARRNGLRRIQGASPRHFVLRRDP